MTNAIVSRKENASKARRARAATVGGTALLASLAFAGLAQAQTAADDEHLTWHGITLYGIIDLGLEYDTNGAATNDYFISAATPIQKFSDKSILVASPNGLSQSRVGLQGAEPIQGDWTGVFKIETYFNPQSGDLTDALKSLVQNNGKALSAQNTNADSSIAGEPFEIAYLGISNPLYGTLTFGRQLTLLADGVNKYDPNAASYAFSLIGWSGTAAGGGDTEDRRLDSALKYALKSGPVHFAALYQVGGQGDAANSAWQFSVGADSGPLSFDLYYAVKKDAVSAGALSAAQVAELPTLGYSVNNSLTGTVSDNTTYGAMGSLDLGRAKAFFGYERISFENPDDPLTAGWSVPGGYVLAFVNNDAYANAKHLQVVWAGVKVALSPRLDLTGAYYGYIQNSYATGADAGCSTSVAGSCSGNEHAISIDFVEHLTKRFDAYLGTEWSEVSGGLSNGYEALSNYATSAGLRFTF
jgi:predicted porin